RRQRLLARKVRTVADPHRQRPRAECLAEADALDVVFDRLLAHDRIGVRQRSVAIAVLLTRRVLERVGIDCVEAQSERGGALAQRARLADLVPREMRRHARRDAAQLLHDRAILELLVEAGRLARDRKAREARAADADT